MAVGQQSNARPMHGGWRRAAAEDQNWKLIRWPGKYKYLNNSVQHLSITSGVICFLAGDSVLAGDWAARFSPLLNLN